LKSGYRR